MLRRGEALKCARWCFGRSEVVAVAVAVAVAVDVTSTSTSRLDVDDHSSQMIPASSSGPGITAIGPESDGADVSSRKATT